MGTHKSAAVAARQRVQAHLEDQIERLTSAVGDGIRATDVIQNITAEREEFLRQLEERHAAASAELDDAVQALRSLGQNKTQIAELLGIDPRLVRSRRTRAVHEDNTQAAPMPEPATH